MLPTTNMAHLCQMRFWAEVEGHVVYLFSTPIELSRSYPRLYNPFIENYTEYEAETSRCYWKASIQSSNNTALWFLDEAFGGFGLGSGLFIPFTSLLWFLTFGSKQINILLPQSWCVIQINYIHNLPLKITIKLVNKMRSFERHGMDIIQESAFWNGREQYKVT